MVHLLWSQSRIAVLDTALFQSWNTFMKSALKYICNKSVFPHRPSPIIGSDYMAGFSLGIQVYCTSRTMLQGMFPVCFRTLWHAALRRSNHNLECETPKSSWCCLCMLWMSITIYFSKRVHLRCQWVYVSTTVQNGHEKYFERSKMTRQSLQKHISITWLA